MNGCLISALQIWISVIVIHAWERKCPQAIFDWSGNTSKDFWTERINFITGISQRDQCYFWPNKATIEGVWANPSCLCSDPKCCFCDLCMKFHSLVFAGFWAISAALWKSLLRVQSLWTKFLCKHQTPGGINVLSILTAITTALWGPEVHLAGGKQRPVLLLL